MPIEMKAGTGERTCHRSALMPSESASEEEEGFRRAAGEALCAALEADTSVIFGLGPSLRVVYVNPAWRRFGAENGGGAASSEHLLGAS